MLREPMEEKGEKTRFEFLVTHTIPFLISMFQQEFERRSALFSIAVANVIIVNMWENMVGLYNGANMGLLKTVFEVNLQLFQRKGSD
jgi:hypothetical protein